MEFHSSDPEPPRDPSRELAERVGAPADAMLGPAMAEAFPSPDYSPDELRTRARAARANADRGDVVLRPGVRPSRSAEPLAMGRVSRPSWWLRSGVAALAVLCVVGIARVLGPFSGRGTMTSRSYATAGGQRAVVQFADGSRMTLAPRSRVAVEETWTRDSALVARRVVLSGEAHFEVVSNAHTPFLVQTGAVVTRVLGTTFDVRRYADDATGAVTVDAGKVMVAAPTGSALLTAGMVGAFTDSTVSSGVLHDPSISTDWANGRLVFHEAPVSEVFATLHRWYGYDFQLSDSALATQHVTGTFPIGETATMLQLVKRVFGVDLTFQDSLVILHPTRDAHQPAHQPAPAGRPRDLLHVSPEVGR